MLVERGSQTPEELNAVRGKFVEALGIALGGNPFITRVTVAGLVQRSAEVQSIPAPTKDMFEENPDLVAIIKGLGNCILQGSELENYLNYPVGGWVLLIMKSENPAELQPNLRSWVDLWTDGERVNLETFDRLTK